MALNVTSGQNGGPETASAAAHQRFESMPVALPIGPQEPVEAPYWEGLKAGEIRIQHCTKCDLWIWSPSWICPQCHGFDPTWEAVDPVGEVYTWATTHHVFPAATEFEGHVPFTTAFVSILSAGGRRLFGLIVGDQSVRIGTRVRAWIQPASELTGGWPALRWYKDEVG
jgi:uncharacterized OB-fold protein